jgi:hypothetical protein
MSCIYIQSGICPGVTGYGDLAYFGLNSNDDPYHRLDAHYKLLKKGTHTNLAIQDFFNDYGYGLIYRDIILECDPCYLNTLEKAYIHFGNSNCKINPEGWNKSRGGEGATVHQIPYSFLHSGVQYQGDDLLKFLTVSGQKEPGGFVQLLDGRLKEYEGFTLC